MIIPSLTGTVKTHKKHLIITYHLFAQISNYLPQSMYVRITQISHRGKFAIGAQGWGGGGEWSRTIRNEGWRPIIKELVN